MRRSHEQHTAIRVPLQQRGRTFHAVRLLMEKMLQKAGVWRGEDEKIKTNPPLSAWRSSDLT